jgi:hypothetical protein
MAGSSSAIKAGRAFLELFADDSKLVSGPKKAKFNAFGAGIRDSGMKIVGMAPPWLRRCPGPP